MMRHYILPAGERVRPLPFYLAMEEWVAHNLDGDDAFFMWQVNPTVIFGRNQQIDAEVNLDYCREKGIEVYRRKSGGGCVFADMSNLMLSYITSSRDDIATIFGRYTRRVAQLLRSQGVDAEPSGRNDITIGGRKVSGNAFYRTPEGKSIVHGTLLFDTDMSHLANAITPSRSKLESKKVKSVESRVTMLKEHTSLTITDFRRIAAEALCDSSYTLTPADIEEVDRLTQPYLDPAWIQGRIHRVNKHISHRIDNVGEVNTALEISPDGKISDINLTGDFFPTIDLDKALLQRLRGVKYDPVAVAEALREDNDRCCIAGLDNNQLINILF